MQYYLLEIVTACGLAFLYGEYGPFIYSEAMEAQKDVNDNGEEGIVEVYLEPDGEVHSDFYDWEFIQRVLALNGFSEKKYRKYVKSILLAETANNA